MSNSVKKAYIIKVEGLVQGVGFRPFIYRIANSNQINGWVENRNDGVVIHAEGEQNAIDDFKDSIKKKAPVASKIFSLSYEPAELMSFKDFNIVKSKNSSNDITEISPDIAVCADCLHDMKEQPHRISYPFINCTNCGPRFTIIKNLPYDRKMTTMAPFIMCDKCSSEYQNINDRRFHAQPIACNDCGPVYEMIYQERTINDINEIINIFSALLEDGKIVTIKGLGGFHMACDAKNEAAVKKLRKSKNRDGKPFAVMFKNIDCLREYANINTEEEELLLSWRKPIVLLNKHRSLAPSVSVGFHTIGAMLPYMPFHYLLFEKINIPAIVFTSGNISEEPIIIDNKKAIDKLLPISDAVIIYNREIYNRTDDSVTTVVNGKERILRRSRGYAPAPVRLNFDVSNILATGAELVNCFCIGKGKLAFLSQHIGDLKNIETLDFFTESIKNYKGVFRADPGTIVCDLHPDYLSTKYALEQGLPIIQVQHHHAHIASCMAENGLDEKVIGVALDGTGFGDDGHIWGGEFLLCDLADYQRIFHFDYVAMPGGDKASKEPWRMAISYLYKAFGKKFLDMDLPVLKEIDTQDILFLLSAIDKNINTPLTSSAGRLFDAVASLTGICHYSGFHAEAPMRLEKIIASGCSDTYSFQLNDVIDFQDTIKEIVQDIFDKIAPSIISAKFHNTIINVIFAASSIIRNRYDINSVVLSGGTFQNRYIAENVEKKLNDDGFKVITHSQVPSNDGGIALGQLSIAAKRRENSKFRI